MPPLGFNQVTCYRYVHVNSPFAMVAQVSKRFNLDTNNGLQIYGGYALALLLVLLFCLDCRIWVKAKINYVFIFEFDPRHNLDWHQLCEVIGLLSSQRGVTNLRRQLPCLLCLLLGMTLWLNFQQSAYSAMFLYWPVFLAGISAIILFFPAPVLYHKSRAWWAYSNVGQEPTNGGVADLDHSSDSFSLASIRSNFGISFLEICSVR